MNDSLVHFLATCRDAFAYLSSEYGFCEITNPPESPNPYIVVFTNGDISLRIIGSGYGADASAEYIAPDGRTVASPILEPDWEPNTRRMRRKKHREPKPPQDDQIRAVAQRICARDREILQGNYVKLLDAASRQERLLSKYASRV
jgi:hypothetical protein